MNRVIEGLQLIAKYDPDVELAGHNDQLFVGHYETLQEKMTEEDILKLDNLGFFEEEESYSVFL